jgi:hypothetical protein
MRFSCAAAGSVFLGRLLSGLLGDGFFYPYVFELFRVENFAALHALDELCIFVARDDAYLRVFAW